MSLPKKNCFTTYVDDIPKSTKVCNKTGSNGYTCGDMGIIVPEKISPYIMVGIIEQKEKVENDWWEWVGTQRNVIREISKEVYTYMDNRKCQTTIK